MLLTEYDEQRHIESEKELSREEGRLSIVKEVAPNLFARGISIEEVSAICREEIPLVTSWYEEWKTRQ